MKNEWINPFVDQDEKDTDTKLVESILKGNRDALDDLIRRHQHWIFNIALRMVLNPQDAEDVTQEILIKVITKLSTFRGTSAFRTWLYRIVKNHVLNMKERELEKVVISFDQYGKALDDTPDLDLPDERSLPVELKVIVEEAKIGCMMGMLLCLDREQRLVYILGEVFEVTSELGAAILEISSDNFRQKLSRSRKHLVSFMNEKCGLINKANPCRCERKTSSFINLGYVDPHNLKFNAHYIHTIKEVSKERSREFCDTLDRDYGPLFRDHPFQDSHKHLDRIKEILESKNFQTLLNLN